MGCPGSASYSIDGDGLVEVNGAVPHFEANSKEAARLQQEWARWGGEIWGAAKRNNLLPAWLLGLMMQESGGRPGACSPCSDSCCSEHLGRRCCAFGIMQFVPATAQQYGSSAEQMLQDPALAISLAGRLLSDLLKRYEGDLVLATVSYNAGSPRCGGNTTFGYVTDNDYPLQVATWSNTAILLGLKKPSIAAPVVAAMGLFAASMILTDVWKPTWA